MGELDCKESRVPKNWCFWTVVLEKTLESPLDCKEIQPGHPKWDQSWVFIGKTDVQAETQILWPPDVKSWLIWTDPNAGKHWGQENKGTTEGEMAGWHHQLNGHGFGWTLGVSDGQGGLTCYVQFMVSQRVRHNWAPDLNWTELFVRGIGLMTSHVFLVGELVSVILVVLPVVQVPGQERRLPEIMQLAIGEFITDSSQGLPPSPWVWGRKALSPSSLGYLLGQKKKKGSR